MKLVYKFGLLLLLVGLAHSSLSAKDRKEYTKTIKKEFDITADGTTKIKNKYGTVEVKTWDRNRVKIDVTIVVKASSESNAQKVFERIDIDFSNRSDFVSAETVIEPTKSKWWNWGNSKSDYSINYEVFLPPTNDLDLTNKYGDVYVAKLKGKGNLNVKYGNFKLEGFEDNVDLYLGYGTGTLTKVNDINGQISYGRLRVGDAADAEMTSKYSNITFEKADEVRTSSKYDTYNLGNVREFRNSGKYDNIEIKAVENVVIGSKYTNIYVENVRKVLDLDMEYGGASVEQLAKGFSDVNLNGRFTDFKLNLEGGTNYRMDASANYAGIRYPRVLVVTYEKDKGTNHEVKGHVGSENAPRVIKARLSYGGLKVRQN